MWSLYYDMKFNNTLLTIAFGFLNISSTLDAQQPDIKGVAFEKAIFFQESKRDYKAASELFKSVIEKYKDHELEARYRLSQCQKQLGKNLEYQETLILLSKEKNQTNKWVKLARKERIDDDVLVHLEKKIIQQKIKIQNSKSQLEALAKKYKISYLGNRIEQETVDSPTEEQRLHSA